MTTPKLWYRHAAPKRGDAEALAARYRHAPWYLKTGLGGDSLHLYVTEACPFRNHRPVNGHPVTVHVTTHARPA